MNTAMRFTWRAEHFAAAGGFIGGRFLSIGEVVRQVREATGLGLAKAIDVLRSGRAEQSHANDDLPLQIAAALERCGITVTIEEGGAP